MTLDQYGTYLPVITEHWMKAIVDRERKPKPKDRKAYFAEHYRLHVKGNPKKWEKVKERSRRYKREVVMADPERHALEIQRSRLYRQRKKEREQLEKQGAAV